MKNKYYYNDNGQEAIDQEKEEPRWSVRED